MRRIVLLACSLPLLSTLALGQRLLSVGIKGGVPFTDAFNSNVSASVDVVTNSFSASKNYVIGPFAELHLPLGLSIEADALYRPLNLAIDTQVIPQSPRRSVVDFSSWEFPILGKYHFLHTPVVKPYVEAGPIFRHVESQASYLSSGGFALGGGVDVKVLRVTITPELRYSRWGTDAALRTIVAVSNVNQAEFLIGLSF